MLAWQHLTTVNQRIKFAKRVLTLYTENSIFCVTKIYLERYIKMLRRMHTLVKRKYVAGDRTRRENVP